MPHSHPNQHIQEELDLIRHKHRYHRHEGLAQVYRKLKDAGYTRTYDSVCRQIRKMKLNTPKKHAIIFVEQKTLFSGPVYLPERAFIMAKETGNLST